MNVWGSGRSQSIVNQTNSTTTPLAAGASFTGEWVSASLGSTTDLTASLTWQGD